MLPFEFLSTIEKHLNKGDLKLAGTGGLGRAASGWEHETQTCVPGKAALSLCFKVPVKGRTLQMP